MATYSYNASIPQAGDNPSQSQADILQNFSSVSGLIATDHVGFNVANGGLHKQVNLVNGSSPSLLGDCVLYSNAGNLFFKKSGQDTQVSGVAPTIAANGYTWLPGGIVLQWGTGTIGAGLNFVDITMPYTFPTATYSISAIPNGRLISNAGRGWYVTNVTTSSFRAIEDNSVFNASTTVYWMAIGK